jgi:hypothetical protein
MPPVPDTVSCVNMQKRLIRKSRVLATSQQSSPSPNLRACHIHWHVTSRLARDQAKFELNVETLKFRWQTAVGIPWSIPRIYTSESELCWVYNFCRRTAFSLPSILSKLEAPTRSAVTAQHSSWRCSSPRCLAVSYLYLSPVSRDLYKHELCPDVSGEFLPTITELAEASFDATPLAAPLQFLLTVQTPSQHRTFSQFGSLKAYYDYDIGSSLTIS